MGQDLFAQGQFGPGGLVAGAGSFLKPLGALFYCREVRQDELLAAKRVDGSHLLVGNAVGLHVDGHRRLRDSGGAFDELVGEGVGAVVADERHVAIDVGERRDPSVRGLPDADELVFALVVRGEIEHDALAVLGHDDLIIDRDQRFRRRRVGRRPEVLAFRAAGQQHRHDDRHDKGGSAKDRETHGSENGGA